MISRKAERVAVESVEGQIVDVVNRKISPGRIEFSEGIITEVVQLQSAPEVYIIPGLIDAHIHIESSHLCPSRFAEAVVPHGTTAIVSDPHEIANVFGMDGVRFMIDDSKNSPLRCFFTAPSCVPATPFETSGAKISHTEVSEMLAWPEIVALGEMMNFPGAIAGDAEVLKKIEAARIARKPIDGHAPLLSGDNLKAYVSLGISTDHECTSSAEAEEKYRAGMIIQIREGSASKNLLGLKDFATKHPFMVVSDDRSAHDLLNGHMNLILKQAIDLGIDVMDALRATTILPAEHYNLPGGWLERGRAADFVILKGIRKFEVLETWIAGRLAARNGSPLFSISPKSIERVSAKTKRQPSDFLLRSKGKWARIIAIVALKDEIVTEKIETWLPVRDNVVQPDTNRDLIRIGVINRYRDAPVANAFIKGFELKEGAIASTVAHDSHNCIVVGIEEDEMANAANISLARGGFTVVGKGKTTILELSIGGLMSDRPAKEVAESIDELIGHAKQLGCTLSSPFMTLSFMSLLVVPSIKLGDRGLFDVNQFNFVNPIIEFTDREPEKI